MLDPQTCKKVLNSGDTQYSDEEVQKISQLLWRLAELNFEVFNNDAKENNSEKSHS